MPKENERWNPWTSKDTAPTSQADLANTRQKIDPFLTDVVGDMGDAETVASPDPDVLDMLENMRMHGGADIPRDGKKVSLAETKKALAEMSKQRYANLRRSLFPRLLESAEANLGPDSHVVKFLRAGISGDQDELHAVLKLLDVQ
jgi:hypothetical protein